MGWNGSYVMSYSIQNYFGSDKTVVIEWVVSSVGGGGNFR